MASPGSDVPLQTSRNPWERRVPEPAPMHGSIFAGTYNESVTTGSFVSHSSEAARSASACFARLPTARRLPVRFAGRALTNRRLGPPALSRADVDDLPGDTACGCGADDCGPRTL